MIEGVHNLEVGEVQVPDLHNFTKIEGVLHENKSSRGAAVICQGDFIIEAGKRVNLPVKITHGKKPLFKERAYLVNVVEGLQKAAKNRAPIFTTPKALIKHGFPLVNNQDHPLIITKGDRLAEVVVENNFRTKNSGKVYGVVDTGRYLEYLATNKIPQKQEVEVFKLDSAKKKSYSELKLKASPAVRDVLKKLESSRYANLLQTELPDILQRLEHVVTTIKMGHAFNEKEQEEVLLVCCAYADRFSIGWWDLPLVDTTPFRVKTEGKPIKLKLRPTPLAARAEVERQIDELLKANVIRRVKDSPWAFPLVIVIKKNGKIRLATDYRLINNITEIPNYPVPHIDTLVRSIRGMHYMGSLDMSQAYHQFPLAEEDQIKSTIVTESGAYAYNRVPFGMSGAVTYFQSRMEEILQPAKDNLEGGKELIMSYIDDIVVGGAEFHNFTHALVEFFTQFRIKNARISTEKSEFGVKEITYLGYRVNAECYYPNPERMEALLKRPAPDTLKGIRGLVSTLSFYNAFLPYLSDLLDPFLKELRELQQKAGSKRSNLIKSELPVECHNVWERIKDFIRDKIVLYHIDPKEDYYIFVDASDVAAGAVIFQRIEGNLRIVAFFSKIFDKAQRNYHTSEREMLGVMFVLEKFKTFLLGHYGPKIHIFTDHMALVTVMTSKAPTKGRLERWRGQLGDYNLVWHHLPGKMHGAADWLSRPNDEVIKHYDEMLKGHEEEEFDMSRTPECLTMATSKVPVEGVSYVSEAKIQVDFPAKEILLEVNYDKVIEAQKSDPLCLLLKDHIINVLEDSNAAEKNDAMSREDAVFRRKCYLHKGVVMTVDALAGDTLVPVLPRSMQMELIRTVHEDELGHLRGDRVFTAIAERCNWPTMRKDIDAFLRKCEVCLKYNPGMRFQAEPGHFCATRPMEQITMDVAYMRQRKTEFPLALCAECSYTHYIWVIPLKAQRSEDQIEGIRNTILSFNHRPKEFITDKHTAYTSKAFSDFLKVNGITASISQGYWSTHVALINRGHRTIRQLLAKCTEEGEDWVDKIPLVTRAYNTSIHPATGFSPYFMLFGQEPAREIDKWLPLPKEKSGKTLKTRLEEYEMMKEVVRKKHLATRLKQMAEFEKNKSSKRRHDPKIGERVMRCIELNRLKEGKQSAVKVYGPYIITNLDKDRRHAYILNEFGGENQEAIRVRWEELIPIGDRMCTPIYASSDVVKRELPTAEAGGDGEIEERKKKKVKKKLE